MNQSERNEWLQNRKTCITGTDIAAICGISKWKSPLVIYMEKTGLIGPAEDNPFMEWGRRLEPLIADKYEENNDIKLSQGEFLRCGIYGGTPDRFAADRIVEIKSAGIRSSGSWGIEGTDAIPPEYLAQIQWYMMLKDRDFGDCAVLIGGNDYREYRIHRNEKLLDVLRRKATHFWENFVLRGISPEPYHAADNKILSILYPSHKNSLVELKEHELDFEAKRLTKLKEDQKTIEENIERLQIKIKDAIKDNLGVKGEHWSATWKKSNDSKKIDWSAVAKELNASQEIINKHTTTIEGSRRFVFKSSFDEKDV